MFEENEENIENEIEESDYDLESYNQDERD